MGDRMVILFPCAPDFIADFPVLEAIAILNIRVPNPRGGFLGRARAVVRRNDALRVGERRGVGEVIERGSPRPGLSIIGVGLPVIDVGGGAAWEAQHLVLDLIQ